MYQVHVGDGLYVFVPTLVDASLLCREYIDAHDLGSSAWNGGEVFLEKVRIALVSYNGRVWDNSAKLIWEPGGPLVMFPAPHGVG